uniref:DUF726 domain-containing protein n=1 Tax=Aliivibrio wodanis TaxID=80852 RepID=A0A5Q4YZ68_9GAMM|nr:hypothetical protein AW0309160_03826 [Aliivibrio wodanis]
MMVEDGYTNQQIQEISGACSSAVVRWKWQYKQEMLSITPQNTTALTSAGVFVVDKVMGHWKRSFYETVHVARDLAQAIEETPNLNQCILMGHSLGGRIVRHRLNEISTPNTVSVAYILAGAVSSEAEEWEPLMEKHSTLKLINCMSMSDYVLKSAYRAGTLWDHEPAGLAPILEETHEFTLNLDVSEYASGHMNFKQQELGIFLKKELSQLEQKKRNQLHLA